MSQPQQAIATNADDSTTTAVDGDVPFSDASPDPDRVPLVCSSPTFYVLRNAERQDNLPILNPFRIVHPKLLFSFFVPAAYMTFVSLARPPYRPRSILMFSPSALLTYSFESCAG